MFQLEGSPSNPLARSKSHLTQIQTMAKRSILPPEILSADTRAFFDVLNSEQDFSVVVIATAYIDACLASLLHKRLLASSVSDKLLDPRGGALGTFASRADASYALGLISKALYQDLLILAEIRNHCAHHHLSLSFDSSDLATSCAKLCYALTLKNGDIDEPMFRNGELSSTRNRFVLTAVLISQRLLLTALGVARVQSVA